MYKYFVIKNHEGRYLKVRTGSNGKTRAWVNDLKGASVFTQPQVESINEGLRTSPFADKLSIIEIGEGISGWMAKKNAVRDMHNNDKTDDK